MRSVLSVSIPAATLHRLKKKAKDQDITVSAYIQRIVLQDQEEDLMTEDQLLAFANEAERDVRTGKTKRLKKPEDLLLPELP